VPAGLVSAKIAALTCGFRVRLFTGRIPQLWTRDPLWRPLHFPLFPKSRAAKDQSHPDEIKRSHIYDMLHLDLRKTLLHRSKMTTLNDRTSLIDFLKTRRSASAKAMTGPGPDAAQLHQILEIAVRVPDHGKLNPWRFVLFEGAARGDIGKRFSARWAELHPSHTADSLAFQSKLFERAPVVLAVVSTAAVHAKIPIWEQQLSAAAACFNAVLAASALGFDAQWQTDWVAYDAVAKHAMGLTEAEAVAGIIYIGVSAVPLEDRPRPDPQTLLTRWGG
jgi:nitroreductase